jgi:Uma2 family endonuclease
MATRDSAQRRTVPAAARTTAPETDAPELHNGDRMGREEFHRLYEQTPPDFKAELIGGTVFVASPLTTDHGTPHALLGTLFGTYSLHTPGVEVCDNTTVRLGEESEPQPDLCLRILPEYGGQSGTTPDRYVQGAPELVAEVALSRRSLDLHGKRDDYARHGVREYLVLSLRERRLRWFDLRANEELNPGPDGVVRVRTFPGLWIDVAALLARDPRMLAVLQQGLATPEHADFVRRLAAARQAASGGKKSPRGRRRGKGPGRGRQG